MNIIPDGLTLIRGVLILFILLIGINQGVKSLPIIAVLVICCQVTDVLDGKLSRESKKPTRLGKFDLVADSALTIILTICLILQEIIFILPAVIVLTIALLGSIIFTQFFSQKISYGIGLWDIYIFSLAEISFVHLDHVWRFGYSFVY